MKKIALNLVQNMKALTNLATLISDFNDVEFD